MIPYEITSIPTETFNFTVPVQVDYRLNAVATDNFLDKNFQTDTLRWIIYFQNKKKSVLINIHLRAAQSEITNRNAALASLSLRSRYGADYRTWGSACLQLASK